MSIKIKFPETNVVGCKFLRYDSSQRKDFKLHNPGEEGYRPTEFIINPDSKTYLYRCIPGVKPKLGGYCCSKLRYRICTLSSG